MSSQADLFPISVSACPMVERRVLADGSILLKAGTPEAWVDVETGRRMLWNMSPEAFRELLQLGEIEAMKPNEPLGNRRRPRKDGRPGNHKWQVSAESILQYKARMEAQKRRGY